MPFCTTKRWNARRWGTATIDRIDSAPTAVLDCWGVPIRKRWVDASRRDVTAIDNGKRFVIDDDTTLRWEHDTKGPFEGGQFKETIQLDKAPEKARWCTRLELPHGVQFHYQPALTQEEIEDGAERPEWCVGSYVVLDGTGCKIGHIPRPYAVTADGKRRWFDLKIDHSPAWGVYMTVLGDLAWLKSLPKSAFPVLVDPTLGYTTIGGSSQNNYPNTIVAMGTFTGTAGTLDNGYAYQGSGGNANLKLMLYTESGSYPADLVATSAQVLSNLTWEWKSAAFAGESVSAVSYWVSCMWSNYKYYKYDSTANLTRKGSYTYASGAPDPFPSGIGYYTRDPSLYVTYTETAISRPPVRRVQYDKSPSPIIVW